MGRYLCPGQILEGQAEPDPAQSRAPLRFGNGGWQGHRDRRGSSRGLRSNASQAVGNGAAYPCVAAPQPRGVEAPDDDSLASYNGW